MHGQGQSLSIIKCFLMNSKTQKNSFEKLMMSAKVYPDFKEFDAIVNKDFS